MIDKYDPDMALLFFVGYGEEWSDCYSCHLEALKKQGTRNVHEEAVDRTLVEMSVHPSEDVGLALHDHLAPWWEPEFDIGDEL